MLALCIAGLCLLSLIAGAANIYFKGPGSQLLTESFKGGQTWQKETKKSAGKAAPNEGARIKKMDRYFARHTVTWDKEQAFSGYTLVSSNLSTQVLLLDMQGNTVHRWNVPFNKAWPNPTHINKVKVTTWVEGIDLFSNGDILAQYNGIGDTPYGYGLARLDKDSHVVWTFDENAHHDVYIDHDSGTIYAMAHHFVKDPIPGYEKLEYPVLSDEIVLLSPEGKVQKRISLFDAFRDTRFEGIAKKKSKRAAWDHFHSNSVMPLSSAAAANFPKLKAGDILVSVRNLNLLAVIDPDTQKVVRIFKGPWQRQHSARFLDNGNLLLFDNLGGSARGDVSRAVEYNPKNQKIVWSYGGKNTPIFSKSLGVVQRLPNGNTLVTVSDGDRVVEVNPEGKVVWGFILPTPPHQSLLAPHIRYAKRYDLNFPAFLSSAP